MLLYTKYNSLVIDTICSNDENDNALAIMQWLKYVRQTLTLSCRDFIQYVTIKPVC